MNKRQQKKERQRLYRKWVERYGVFGAFVHMQYSLLLKQARQRNTMFDRFVRVKR